MLGLGTRYAALVGCVLAMFINFVACGSQLYKLSLDGDTQVKSVDNRSNPAAPPDVTDPTSPHFGLNAPGGWVDLPIHFKVSNELTAAQKTGLLRAMRTWETAVGKPLFIFEGNDDRTGNSFPDLYSSLDDNVNGYYMDDNWQKTKKPTIVLATTIWNNFAGDTSKIDTADIRFNAQYYLMGDAFSTVRADNKDVVDMQTLATHELGHMLGLAHIEVDDPDSIMTPALYIGEGLANRRLSRGDLDRIQKIYGCTGDACDHDKVLAAIEVLNKANRQDSKPKVVEQDTAH
jgi:hypothetical protein